MTKKAIYLYIAVAACAQSLLTMKFPQPAKASFEHVPIPAHGTHAMANLAQCGQCHRLHPEPGTAPDSWGWPQTRMANITCTYCHDPNRVADTHYNEIDSAQMRGNAGDTIYKAYGYNGKDQPS